jgi:hypothetical protein
MIIISHRRNTIEELRGTSEKYGVEVDIRSNGSDLIINHDPFSGGILFSDWISNYRHKTLILNVKEEGLESKILSLLDKQNISDFLFLDQSFPFLLKSALGDESRLAIRVSEYETIHTALNLAGRVEWVWVDCFSKFPLTLKDSRALLESGFKLCIVSPELQGRSAETEIPKLRGLLDNLGIHPNAVCTKRPDLWESFGTST